MPKRGRPKGSKNKATVDKELLREQLRALVRAELEPMVQAQIDNAKGIKYLVARQKSGGKFVELTEEAVKAVLKGDRTDLELIEVWEKQPNVQAFTDLMNRTIDKPPEQVDVEHTGGLEITWRSSE